MSTPLFSQRRFVVTGLLALVAWILLHWVLLIWYDIDRLNAIIDSGVNSVMLALACMIVSNSLRYYQPEKGRYWYLVAWSAILASISTALTIWILSYLVIDADYNLLLFRSIPLRFCVSFLATGWSAQLSALWYAQQEYRDNEKRKADAERLAREAELYNLRQQLQPHFLFNSLNSITALVGRRPDEARNMIHQLSDFLRGTLKKEDQAPVRLQEELDHLQLYLDIEKVRFGHRLETHVDACEICREMKLPPMLLQPLVENAIKFGLYDTTGNVPIRLWAEYQEGILEVNISNPFDPQTSKPRPGTGFGLSGVKRRLYLLYGRTDLLHTRIDNHIFITTVKVPQK